MNNIFQLLASEDLEKDIGLFFIPSGEFIFTNKITEFVEIDGFKFKINTDSITYLYEYFKKDPKEIDLFDIINLDESDLGICPKFAVIHFISTNYQKHITKANFDRILSFMIRVAKSPKNKAEYRLNAELSATKFGGFSFLGYLEDILPHLPKVIHKDTRTFLSIISSWFNGKN
jgi:hypothetical protein